MLQHRSISKKHGSQKILITGGAGFIGSNFTHFYINQHPNDTVFVLDKLTYAGNLDNISDLIETKKITFIRGDIAEQEFVRTFFETEKFNTVVNFAAETHVDRSIIDPRIFVKTNIMGTHNLLFAARENGVSRYHQISTDEVYGDLGDNSKNYFTEETKINPNCPYAASKAAADILVMSYFATYKMPVTISRCSNNYGPYQFPEKLIPYFLRLASEGHKLPVYGDGQNVRDWLYVADHCRAIDVILQSRDYGEIYNIGGHNEYTNLQIIKFILKFLDKNDDLITFVEDRKAHDRRYAMDPSKIEKKLGWKPSVNFEDGIKKTFEWYRANKKWMEKLMKKYTISV